MKIYNIIKRSLFLLMLLPLGLFGQAGTCDSPPNCIENGSFDGPTGTSNLVINSNPASMVPNWSVSHGTATTPTISPTQNNSIGMVTYGGSRQGVFTCYNFVAGQTYCVSIQAKFTGGNNTGSLQLDATTGLTVTGSSTPPIPTSFQSIANENITSSSYAVYSYTFTANANYNQLWIKAFLAGGGVSSMYNIRFDNVHVENLSLPSIAPTISLSGPILNGVPLVLTATGGDGAQFNWSTGQTGNQITIIPNCNTTQTISVTASYNHCELPEPAVISCQDISDATTISILATDCCSDSCYWKLTGNNIIGENNIFGTLSNDDIRIFTNNISRGIITRQGNVGLGTVIPTAKLDVYNDETTSPNIAISSIISSEAPIAYGTYSLSRNNHIAIGATGFGQGAATTTSKIGLWGSVVANSCTGNNIGVYGNIDNMTGVPCGTHFAGYFAGQIVSAGPSLVLSDGTLKTNVLDLTNAMDIIRLLKPRTYDFDPSVRSGYALTDKHQYGFISQEVERVLPDVVQEIPGPVTIDKSGTLVESSTTYKAMNYDALISVLVKAVQEQDERINDLEALLTSCCESKSDAKRSGSSDVNVLDISISDNNTIVLNQNVPNPFAEVTSITYYIPETFNQASMFFTNIQGQVIKTIVIKEMGKGQLNVFADDLTSGQYTYTLVVDGKNIETKKMIKQ